MKKLLSLALSLFLLLSMVPAMAEDVPTFVITLKTHTLVTDYEDNYLTKWIEENYGCNLEFNLLPAGEEGASKLNMMVIGEEDLGDIIIWESGLGAAATMSYADAGAILPMNEYIEKLDTNLEAMSDLLNVDFVAASKMPDGSIYSYPIYSPGPYNVTQYRAWINTTWLENLDLEMPTTPDELYNVLKAFKEQDANGNGDPNDEIPMLGCKAFSSYPQVFLLNGFVYYDRSPALTLDDGKVNAAYVQEGYRAGLSYINKLVEEGLIAKDSWTITSGQYKEYLATEIPTVGVHLYTNLAYMGPTDENKNQYEWLRPLIGADGEQRVPNIYASGSPAQTLYIPASAKDPEASFKLIDWLFTNEAFERARYGVEGIHYEKVTDAETLKMMNLEEVGYAITEGPNGWGEANNMSWQIGLGNNMGYVVQNQWNGDPNYYQYKRQTATQEMLKMMPQAGEYVPALVYTTEEQEAYNELSNTITTFYREYEDRFILGDLDVDDDAVWQAYLDTLYNEMGMEDYLKIIQTAYDRTYAK